MAPETIIAAIIGIAGAVGLQQLVPGLIALRSGAADREKHRVQQLIRERDEAEAERDASDAYRRKVEEMASQSRRMAIEAGVDPLALPAWPSRDALDALTRPEEH